MSKSKRADDPEVPPSERRLKELIDGAPPKNEAERKIVREIEADRKKGIVPDIPFD